MPGAEIELNPVDFITIGTVGPKGKRVFYLQAGYKGQIASMIIEKEQSWALSEAINEFLDDLDKRFDREAHDDAEEQDMSLREPIEPLFRVAQMGLGYDENQDMIVLIAQELIPSQNQDEESPQLLFDEDDELHDDELGDDSGDDEEVSPSVVRFWCSRKQMKALSAQAMLMVESGRADPKQNGRIIYYWT